VFQSERRTLLNIPEINMKTCFGAIDTKLQIRRILRHLHPTDAMAWNYIYAVLVSVSVDCDSKTLQRFLFWMFRLWKLISWRLFWLSARRLNENFWKSLESNLCKISLSDASNCSEMFCSCFRWSVKKLKIMRYLKMVRFVLSHKLKHFLQVDE